METVYHDGDTLLIEMTDFIESGEIGIFSIDGKCYVKKRQAAELSALNADAANIPIGESVRCMGKVIDNRPGKHIDSL